MLAICYHVRYRSYPTKAVNHDGARRRRASVANTKKQPTCDKFQCGCFFSVPTINSQFVMCTPTDALCPIAARFFCRRRLQRSEIKINYFYFRRHSSSSRLDNIRTAYRVAQKSKSVIIIKLYYSEARFFVSVSIKRAKQYYKSV